MLVTEREEKLVVGIRKQARTSDDKHATHTPNQTHKKAPHHNDTSTGTPAGKLHEAPPSYVQVVTTHRRFA